MAFNSFQYFLFLPTVYLVFYFVGDKGRWLVLLLASAIFYAALNVPYLLLMLGLVTIITYVSGIWIELSPTPSRKTCLLWSGIGCNTVILLALKYLPVLTNNLNQFFHLLSWNTNLPVGTTLVTVGLSFYVFQAISYLVDIYLEIEKPEKHFGYFALYLSFFPKLLQGPIERAQDLLPQLRKPYEFNYDDTRSGMLLFTWGLFKKVVVADRLALFVNPVYDNVHAYSGLTLVLATYLYAMQIYFDFSAYTDMALGTARLFNIKLTRNFDSPYKATSIADFWRRWHISFSRWILDYIFKPLQMKLRDRKNVGTAVALLVTFLISGIWHGASWCFVVWGGLHGLYLAASVFYRPLQKKIYKKLRLDKTRIQKAWQIVITFNLVCFAWIFFRANSLADAWYIVTHLFHGNGHSLSFLLSQNHNELTITLILIIFMLIIGREQYQDKLIEIIFAKPAVIRWCSYYIIIMTILLLWVVSNQAFIYGRF